MYHVQFQLQTVSLSGLDECHSQKSFYHTSMLIQMVGKPHNCTSFKGHFLENGLKPVVCHHVNRIFWKIVHDFSITGTIQTTQWQSTCFHYQVFLTRAVWNKLHWQILQVLHNVNLSSRRFVLIMSVKEISQCRKCCQISGFHSSLSQIWYPTKCVHFIFHYKYITSIPFKTKISHFTVKIYL